MAKIYSSGLLFFILLLTGSDIYSQSYCVPHANSGTTPTRFRRHFLEISFAAIRSSFPEPQGTASTAYYDYTNSDSSILVRGETYSLRYQLGNGANTQTVAIWIDFNQNMKFEKEERLYSKTDFANVGTHIHSENIKIPSTIPLGTTRMRIGTSVDTLIPDPCLNDYRFHFIDYTVRISNPAIQKFISTSATHPDLREVAPGERDVILLRANIQTNGDGTISNLTADSLFFNLTGTTNPDVIDRVNLYYSGTNPDFISPVLIDSLKSPLSTFFNFTPAQKLDGGANYFWLVADLNMKASLGNKLDASYMGAHVITRRTPNVISPTGDRVVGYCRSVGSKNLYIFIDTVNFNGLGINSGRDFDNYGDYTYLSKTFQKGQTYQFWARIGNSVNPNYTQAWIDYNRDGFMDDLTERVFFDSIAASPTAPTTGPITGNVTIPSGAVSGPTLMRVSTTYKPNVLKRSELPKPCTPQLVIGEVEDYTVIINKDGHPFADFSAADICLGDSVKFKNSSSVPGSYSISGYKWYFGDGDSSNIKDPTHKYSSPGTYTVRLQVTSNLSGAPVSEKIKTVYVENPKADFSLAAPKAGTPITFVNQSTGGRNLGYFWDFGTASASDTSYSTNPTFTFQSAGTYKVELKAFGAGCRDSIIRSIKILSELEPVAYFGAGSESPYAGQTLPYLNQSLYATSLKWEISPNYFSYKNNTGSSSQNPYIQLDSVRTYTIKLIATNTAGSDTFTRKLTTLNFKTPVAGFTVDKVSVSAGDYLYFTDTSTNFPLAWNWAFGDGNVSGKQYPSHIYSQTGTFDVRLIASNPAGSDTAIRKGLIKVTDNYIMCRNEQSPLNSGTLYDAGGKAGNYGNNENCRFLINPPCAITNMLIFDTIVIDFGDYLRVYDGVDNTGIPLHKGNGFNKDFDPPDTLFSQSGSFYIEEITGGSFTEVGFEARWIATANPKPVAKIKADSIAWINSPFLLQGSSQAGVRNTFMWDFNMDGNIDATGSPDTTLLFQTTGKDTVRLIIENCNGRDTFDHIFNIKSPTRVPEVGFYATEIKPKLFESLQLIDTSDFGPTSFKWEIYPDSFDDAFGRSSTYIFEKGTSDTSKLMQIIFINPGTYDVCLTAENKQGKSKRVCKKKYIRVYQETVMCLQDTISKTQQGYLYDDGGEFTNYTDGRLCRFYIKPCASKTKIVIHELELNANDYLRIYDGENNSAKLYQPFWFPNGYTGSLSQLGSKVPDTIYARTGMVMIEFETDNSSNNAGFKIEWISEDIKAKIDATSACAGDEVFFSNKSKVPTNSFPRWEWDMGDGNTFVRHTPLPHIYQNSGTYRVKMHLRTNKGCRDTAITHVKVTDPPEVKFKTSNICFGDSSVFINKSIAVNDSITTFIWDFGDSATSSSENPIHTYLSTGNFQTSLIVKTSIGCTDTFSRSVYVAPNPMAGFNVAGKCKPDSFRFFNTSSIASGNMSYAWAFGDGNNSVSENPAHIYSIPGTFPVTLITLSDSGCYDTATSSIFYNPGYFADFSANNGCLGDKTVFTNNSSGGIDTIGSWEWDFGDGQSSTTQSPVKVYSSHNNYPVRLIITMPDGCRDTIIKNIEINPVPLAGFKISGGHCEGDTLTFTDNSNISGGSITTRQWEFSDGKNSSADNFFFTWDTAGTYSFQLAVESDKGCKDTTIGNFTIDETPSSDFSYVTGQNGLVAFSAGQTGLTYEWDFGNGNTGTGDNPNYRYTANGEYLVSLTTTNSAGCTSTTTQTVEVTNVSGLRDHLDFAGFITFPNPTNGKVIIRYDGSSTITGNIRITDLFGRELFTQPTGFTRGTGLTFDLGNYPKGFYLLEIKDDEGKIIYLNRVMVY